MALPCNSAVEKADTGALREVFNKFASVEQDGERYMTPSDFAHKFLDLIPEGGNETSLQLITGVADQTKDGLVSFAEFQAFESLLRAPDALYRLAFQLFDGNADGAIDIGEFKGVIKSLSMDHHIPFDTDCSLVKLYFGADGSQKVDYNDFSQFVRAFRHEYLKQAFHHYETKKAGVISALDFAELMKSFRVDGLSDFVKENLVTVAGGQASHQVSYAYFTAFNSMLDKLPLLEHIFHLASKDEMQKEITKEELLYTAQQFAQVTPLEVDILFQLCDLKQQTGHVSFGDFKRILPREVPVFRSQSAGSDAAVREYREISVGMQVLEYIYRFTLSGIGGACGAAFVYPIDLVKTRMQNQRSSSITGELLYKNSFDCFKKVVRREGPLGLYSGLGPQLIGVAPEKAIKLTTNFTVRGKFTEKDGSIPFYGELIAGGCGGASQVLFTNPLEIVKIRLQVAGEVKGETAGAIRVIKELGLGGMYKGASACFLRDIPFSAIYFPVYAHMKDYLTAGEEGHAGHFMMAAFVAGVPSAGLLTPADVIKTRMQVKVRSGQTQYNGLFDCARKVYKEEGFRAFWKGAGARVCRSSPQFGMTLMVFEILQNLFNVDFGRGKPRERHLVGKSTPLPPLSTQYIGGLGMAKASFCGVERHLGLVLPKFGAPLPSIAK